MDAFKSRGLGMRKSHCWAKELCRSVRAGKNSSVSTSTDICRSPKMPDINSVSISEAWLTSVALAANSPRHEVTNLSVTINGLEHGGPQESPQVRGLLDGMLSAEEMGSVDTVANTIFPASLWNRQRPKEVLFQRYMRAFPKIRKHRANRRGTYLERMINYPTRNGESF